MARIPFPADALFWQLHHLRIDIGQSYRKISWEHVVANTSAADDWRAPKAG